MKQQYKINNVLRQQIDLASFFAAVMVLYIHSSLAMLPRSASYLFVESFVGDGICRIAVPFFFFRSGLFFFFNTTEYTAIFNKIIKRFKTLAIPYFLWASIGLLFLFFASKIPLIQSFIIRDLPWRSISSLTNYIFLDPINYQLWFLRDLLICVLISPVIFLAIRFLSWIPSLIVLALYLKYPLIFPFFYSSFSLFFFVAGATLAIKRSSLLEFSPRLVSFTALIVVFLLLSVYNAMSKSYSVPHVYWLNQLLPILGVVCFWFLIRRFSSLFSFISTEVISLSFFIYLLHEPFLTFIKKVFIALSLSHGFYMFAIYMIVPLFTLTVCITIGLFLKKNARLLYSLLVGSR